ncbi:MAG: hypothetical protein JW751_28470 [Polyangiaceae bacterium]|nr:hypothetical protein [Polyangiaceae bacterium]
MIPIPTPAELRQILIELGAIRPQSGHPAAYLTRVARAEPALDLDDLGRVWAARRIAGLDFDDRPHPDDLESYMTRRLHPRRRA